MRLLLPGLLAAAGAVWGEDVEQALRTFTSVYAAVEPEPAPGPVYVEPAVPAAAYADETYADEPAAEPRVRFI
jgi:hypothetical protein